MGVLKKVIQRGIFVKDKFDKKYPFELRSQINTYYKSFGNKNPDKRFYIIWRDYLGAGYFSNVGYVMTHIIAAEEMGMIPIVDFKNFKTLYNVENPINGTKNAWEYYCNQISPYDLEEVYSSRHVFFCNGLFPNGNNFKKNAKSTKDLFDQYIKFKSHIQKEIDKYSDNFKGKVLGIHLRAKEINYASAHSFGPTLKQMFKYTDQIISEHNIDKILIVSEDKQYQDEFIKRYKDMAFCTNAFKVVKVNAYNLNPRKNHRYLLGLEAIYECMLLSKCNIMLYSDSNLANMAVTLGKHEYLYYLYNGMNSHSDYIARYLYGIKKLLPKKYGGLQDKLTVTKR